MQKQLTIYESLNAKPTKLNLPETLNWYTCGPTIYDDSHLGHARTFITFDTIRRYLESIGHNVVYGMNITDIDDKIITRVKKNHWSKLINQIQKKNEVILEDLSDFDKMEKWLLNQKFQPLTEKDLWPGMDTYNEFITEMEQRFWQDLKSINVKPPTITISVSKVMPEMIKFVQILLDKNLAYVGKSADENKSVYFDTEAYYAKYGQCSLNNSSDEDISLKDEFNTEKKNPRDFSLWKAIKKYEIGFESPWGIGRCSWHLECSAMIEKMFFSQIDIHSGGIDLKYPHHCNEYIQTTAFADNPNWVKYFLHTGHLCINKEKMAKSLNNFVSIKSFLADNSYRVLRLLFLMHQWNSEFDFNKDILKSATELDERISNYLSHIQFVAQQNKTKMNFDKNDQNYMANINILKNTIETSWQNFNTIKVIENIREIINLSYKYLETNYNLSQVQKVASYILSQTDILGLDYSKANKDDCKKFVSAIIEIRDKVRTLAKEKDTKDIRKKLFELTDWIRDVKMAELGTKLSDMPEGTKLL